MAPPELPRDAPVANALEPLGVVVAPTLGDEAEGPVAILLERGTGQGLHADEPLIGEPRLDHGVAAIAVAHRVAVGLDLLEQARRLELRHHAAPRVEAVEALEPVRRREADPCLGRHDVDGGEAVAAADLEVGRIVRRRHLHGPGAEGRVHGIVGHDGHQPMDHRQPELATDQVAVALVLGVHGHRRVPQHRLRTRGGHRDVPAPVGERVAEMPDLPVRLFLFRFLVGEGGEAARAPVDDVVAAVDESRLVERDERLAHGPREVLVQREVGAAPVGGGADGLELLENGGAGLAHITPDALDERLATDVEPGEALLREQALDHVLRRDAGMVGARDPEHPPSAHPLEPDQHVLHGVVETVTHVERGRDVGRRHHHDVGSTGARGREQAALLPPGVEGGLDGGRIVLGGERLGHAL